MSDEYAKQIKSAEAVGTLGDDLFGDKTSFYTGATEFTVTDVSLPGNDKLPVAVGRRFKVDAADGAPPFQGVFADWEIDLPYLSGLFKTSWQSSKYQSPNSRCTVTGSDAMPPTVIHQGANWDAHEYWSGNQLYVPGQGEQEMLNTVAGNPYKPSTGGPYYWVTASQWYFSCLPNTANGVAGEAFLATAPDGTRYWFDWVVVRTAPSVNKPSDEPEFASADGEGESDAETPQPRAGQGAIMPRVEVRILPTRAQDRFGNYVTYAYSGAKLTSIAASDGRQLTLTYNGNYVSSVSDGYRTWNYTYDANGLRTVTLPGNGGTWSYSLYGLYTAGLGVLAEAYTCTALGAITPATHVGSITHPSGAQGWFEFQTVRHGRSYVADTCVYDYLTGSGYAMYAPLFDTVSLTKKTIAGPGLATMQWAYAYGAPNNSYSSQCNPTCVDTKTVEVAGPDNRWTRYTFGNKFLETDGKLLKVETGSKVGANPPTILRTETTAYLTNPAGQAYPAQIGQSAYARSDRTAEKHAPAVQRQIAQQGVNFTWQVNQTNGVYSFDGFANPLSTTRSSSLGYSRTDVAAYHHNYALWVIGQLASSANSNTGLIESQNDYWPATALLQRTYSFGKPQQYFVYNADGTLAWVNDGNANTTSFANWKRGIPQSITFADTTTKSAQVNDLGQIDWVKNETGAKTCYGYDAMGRLASITYPSEFIGSACNQDYWHATTISFSNVTGAVYGLPANHWRRTESTGNARKVTFYDALWRPVVQETYDISNTSNTLTQTVTRYDSDGRVVYASYPQRTLDPAIYNTWGNPAASPNALGTVTAYDALGRPTQITWNSEHGILGASYAYLNNFQTLYTDERGQQTTTYYMAYDQPTTDWISAIGHPEGAITEIYRDAFGKPLNISRHNASFTEWSARWYAYDAYQRLCKQSDVETSTTAFGYDEAGNQIWSAVGLPWSPYAPCEYAPTHASVTPKRVDRTYDARNRLKTLSFPDGRGNQVWNYTPDGLPLDATVYNGPNQTAAVVTAYHYNNRRLLDGETVSQPNWYSWSIGYGYDSHGNLASQSYPTGPTVTYSPNALGQATQVAGSGGLTFASGVSYHPNGGIKQFTYGNGLVHTMAQNARQLPQTSTDSGGVLSHQYSYDYSGNVTQIQDLNRGNDYSRWMTYDGLSRLKSAGSCSFGPGCWFYYDYDTLDNLTRVQSPGGIDRYYCYSAQQHLTNIKSGPCTSGASVVGLGYDDRGNLANKNGQTYDFDFGNRLRDVPAKESYRYDVLGRRVQTTHPDQSLRVFQYSQSGQLMMATQVLPNQPTQTTQQYVYLAGSQIAVVDRSWPSQTINSVKYQHTDALGTPVAETDPTGNVVQRSEYDPYGRLNNRPLTNGPGYTGHYQDAATGLTYMQQRYYDPQIGRFLSMDPVTANANTGANFNRYWYANNNPYRFKDPDGRETRELTYEYRASGAVAPTSDATMADVINDVASFINPFMPAAECISAGCGKGGWAMATISAIPGPQSKVAAMSVRSAIKGDALLVKAAQNAGKSVQKSLDGLTAQLAKGNLNPGIGTKHLFSGVFEARARDGARVYFRKTESGVEILAKSDKGNQGKVIERLREKYGD